MDIFLAGMGFFLAGFLAKLVCKHKILILAPLIYNFVLACFFSPANTLGKVVIEAMILGGIQALMVALFLIPKVRETFDK